MSSRHALRRVALIAAIGACSPAFAQTPSQTTLPEVTVTADGPVSPTAPPIKEKFQLPQTAESVTAQKIQETINVVDTEDAVKYLPSLFVRKRNNGDTQPVLATRTWGVNSSARTLVYADDILISALIANNNTIGAPRWGLIAPEEIKRVDVLYGPFAAAYPGNSMGAVMQITTRMPEKFEFTAKQTETFQTFDRYATADTFRTDQTSLSIGDRFGNIAWFLSGNFQNSYSQPLGFITTSGVPAGTTGIFLDRNKLGAVANVVGAGGLLHTDMGNLKGKLTWDVTSWLKATFTTGYWSNDTQSSVQTYLRTLAGLPTFGSVSGFANSNYTLFEKHLANSVSLKTDTRGAFDWDIAVSRYDFLADIQRSPFGVIANSAAFTTNGKIARLDGTNWTTADAKGIWRLGDQHEISFGLHGDRYTLNNPTYATPTWNAGPDTTSALYTNSKGTTQTLAAWAQDAWRFAPGFKLTLGGRFEYWRAFDGYNLATTTTGAGLITGTTATNQPGVEAMRFSPKASLAFEPAPQWLITASVGQAYRFPTVTELYQIVQTGAVYSVPNANLRPENVITEELAVEWRFTDGKVRLSVFNENVYDALVAQTNLLSGPTPVNFVTNVDAIRNSGVELAASKDNVLFDRLQLFGSVTFVDSVILADSNWASPTGTTVVGKRAPYVPDWRATFGATYRPTDALSLTAVTRYSGKMFSTLDNTDVVANVYGAFDSFMVTDLRAQYKVHEHAYAGFGIDNVFNHQYTLFHPFPGRTFVADVKVVF